MWDTERQVELACFSDHTEFVTGLDYNMHVAHQLADCAWDEHVAVRRLASWYIYAAWPSHHKSRALPDGNGEVAAKEHVEQVLDLVCDFKPKPLPNHHVPGGVT